MVIISLLADARYSAVVSAAPAGTIHQRVNSGAALATAVHRSGCGYAVVDPALVADIPFRDLVVKSLAANVPLLLFGNLDKRSVAACLAAEAICPTNALFADAGETHQLRHLLREPAAVDVPALLLHMAETAMTELPPRVRMPTVALFTGAPVPPSVTAFGYQAGMDRKTLQRWYARVELASVARVLAIARLSRVWRPMRSNRLSLARIAHLAGYGSARTMSRRCRMLAHCAPADARAYSAQEFAGRLVTALLTRAA